MKSAKLSLLVLGTVLCLLSPAAVFAEESVCLQCHAGQEQRLAQPIQEWRGSIHETNGISCHDCHGGDPTDFAMAMSPERGFVGVPGNAEIPAFCGRCHLGVKDDYLASAHGQAVEAGGAQCVTCHGNHNIRKAEIDLINEQSCSRCHDYERASLVKQAISDTEATLTSMEASVVGLHRLGIDVQRLNDELFAKRNDFRRLFHTVNLEKITAQKTEFEAGLAETVDRIAAHEEELSQRKVVGGIITLLLVLGGCIALLIRKTYAKEE